MESASGTTTSAAATTIVLTTTFSTSTIVSGIRTVETSSAAIASSEKSISADTPETVETTAVLSVQESNEETNEPESESDDEPEDVTVITWNQSEPGHEGEEFVLPRD